MQGLSTVTTNGIGQPVRRKEDMRLVAGTSCFSDDVNLLRQARAFVLRSVHAHALITACGEKTGDTDLFLVVPAPV